MSDGDDGRQVAIRSNNAQSARVARSKGLTRVRRGALRRSRFRVRMSSYASQYADTPNACPAKSHAPSRSWVPGVRAGAFIVEARRCRPPSRRANARQTTRSSSARSSRPALPAPFPQVLAARGARIANSRRQSPRIRTDRHSASFIIFCGVSASQHSPTFESWGIASRRARARRADQSNSCAGEPSVNLDSRGQRAADPRAPRTAVRGSPQPRERLHCRFSMSDLGASGSREVRRA